MTLAPSAGRLFLLLDDTRVVAVLGIRQGEEPLLRWVPGEILAAGVWRERLTALDTMTGETVDTWLDAGGPVLDILEVDLADGGVDLRRRAEQILDQVLVLEARTGG